MFKNIILTTFRQLRKNPGYSVLNILGLAIGMTCFILISLWLQNELGYDRYFHNASHIFRVNSDVNLRSGQKKRYALSATGMAKALREEFPEVAASTRWLPINQVLIKKGDQNVFESNFVFAESGFFEVFEYPLISGDPGRVLEQPNSLLLTQSMAHKYFGDTDPIGKALLVNHTSEYKVTGILGDIPANSHIRPSFLAYPGENELFNRSNWMSLGLYTYIRLKEGTLVTDFEDRIQTLAEKHLGPRGSEIFQFRLQPLTAIHLHSEREAELAPQMSVTQIYLLSALAVLILGVACINYINLSTALSSRRSREVGMRKVLGAHRRGLSWQFLLESVFNAQLAYGLSLGLVALALPLFNSLSEVHLPLEFGFTQLFFFSLATCVGFLAGAYPAAILSSYQPSVVLRGSWQRSRAGLGMRKVLIVCQFAVTVIMMIGTAIVFKQMHYMKHKYLGFDKDQIVSVWVRNPQVMQDYEAVLKDLLQNPSIISGAASSSLPGYTIGQRAYEPEGFDGNPIMVLTLYVDHNFISMLGIEMQQGRGFEREFSTDTLNAYVINEAAQKRFGWQRPLGKRITCTNSDETEKSRTGTVIGVARDFHLQSLHQMIEPIVLRIRPESFDLLNLKMNTINLPDTLKFIQEKIQTRQPEFPFESRFLDSQFDSLYRNEQRLGRIFIAFSIIAVLTACLGLFGLSAFLSEQRKKEIGIRKVHGAPVTHVVWLLIREFAAWVGISNILAWPIAYWAMDKWLQNFSYRIQIPAFLFVLSGSIALSIAVFTVSFQALRAASANPIHSLRYE